MFAEVGAFWLRIPCRGSARGTAAKPILNLGSRFPWKPQLRLRYPLGFNGNLETRSGTPLVFMETSRRAPAGAVPHATALRRSPTSLLSSC